MKILYAVQGTGNGHVSRAMDIIPLLQQHGDVDILVSGTQADIQLPFDVSYRFNGLSFIFGKKGGVDLYETYKKSNLKKLFKEINSLPIEEYDLVINDFEPVSAWACYLKGKTCVGLSHQSAVLNKKAPQPKHVDVVGKSVLKHYAPVTSAYGFHFSSYDKNIFTPVIRQQVRSLKIEHKGHYTVYLPAYDDERIVKVLSACDDVKWQVFSKHNKKKYSVNNITLAPIDNEAFIASMATAEGVLCGAGFETPAEALFLQKKLIVIPMKAQYEQHCNAAALKEIGVPVLKSLKKKHVEKIKDWVQSNKRVTVDYPNITASIIEIVLEAELSQKQAEPFIGKKAYTVKKFRDMTLKKLLSQIAG